MKIYKYTGGLSFLDQFFCSSEWAVERRHEGPSLEGDHCKLLSVLFKYSKSLPGVPSG